MSGTYHAGVHYYCEHSIGRGSTGEGSGPTTATLRVFCDGALIGEHTIDLDETDRWVTVSSVDYPRCSGMSIDDSTWGHELFGTTLRPAIECSSNADCPGSEVCYTGRGPARNTCIVD